MATSTTTNTAVSENISSKNLPNTIMEQMEQEGVKFAFSDHDYHACLNVMDCVLGYKPVLNQFCKVWEPGFWTFHLMFKNSMNLPFSMLGTMPDIQDLFLVLYGASRTGGCDYCVAHSIGLALRTGVLPERVICEGSNLRRDKVLYDIAKSLSCFPANTTPVELIEMKRFFTTEKIEWTILTIAAAGFLNIVAIAGGVSLEGEAENEVEFAKEQTKWAFNTNRFSDILKGNSKKMDKIEKRVPQAQRISIILKATKHIPIAFFRENVYTFGVPSSWPNIGKYLKKENGYNFPLMKYLTYFRIITVTYGCILRDHFNSKITVLGCVTKGLIQLMFSAYYNDEHLLSDAEPLIKAMSKKENIQVSDETIDEVLRIGELEFPPETPQECQDALDQLQNLEGVGSRENAAILVLARAVMQRPTNISPIIVQNVSCVITGKQACEILHWVGMLVSFHRVLRFYEIKDLTPEELWKTNEPVVLSSGETMGGAFFVSQPT